MTKPLQDQVALVAGATRGAGRGIARMLGEAGATVWCTGRSARGAPAVGTPREKRRETIEETAALVDAAGGVGIAVRVDHGREEEVRALVARVRAERGRLDVLVNVLGGTVVTQRMTPLWELDLADGRRLFDSWVTPHVVTAKHAAPLLIEGRAGLVVEVIEQHTLGYHGQFFWDLTMLALKRLAFALATELAPHGVTALAVAPGFMRTEEILDHFGATPETWAEVARTSREARQFGFAGSETPAFVGRAIAALAADPDVARRSGGVFGSWELADAYGFTDEDGARPHWGRYFEEHFAAMFAGPRAAVQWETRGAGG